MKREELEALGLDKDTIKEIQRMHGLDMARFQKKMKSTGPARPTREAVAAMLPLLKDPDHLQRVLKLVNTLYYYEIKYDSNKKAADSVCTTGDGKAEQGPQAYSDFIVPQLPEDAI